MPGEPLDALLLPVDPPDEAVSEAQRILGEAAHELSRPLAAVLNYAELALHDPELPPAARKRLEMVVREAERCRAVTRRFLEQGRPAQPFTDTVDLNQVVQRAVAVAPVAQAVGVFLGLDPSLPPVTGDARDLEAAIRNLLENATYAAQSAPHPEVRLETRRLPGGVRLTVTDNGPGLPEAMADRIFEPFVTTKPSAEGSGLGLAITRRIVREHEGQVRAERAPSGGAAFVIELPAKPPPGAVQPLADLRAKGTPRKVLVVDDDASMRKLLATYLEGMNYDVTEAANGCEALRISQGSEFHAIICDMNMPEMGGEAYYRALCEAFPTQAERVIFATGVLPTNGRHAFLRTLPNAQLRKPFRLAALRLALGSLDEARGGRHRLTPSVPLSESERGRSEGPGVRPPAPPASPEAPA